MNAVRQRRRGNRLKGAVAALGVAALALVLWTLAAAQDYAGRPSAEEDAATEGASPETDSPTVRGTPDSATSSTFEAPTVTSPVVGGSENQLFRPVTPPSAEETPCTSCDQQPDTPVGDTGSLPDAASYTAQNPELDADDVATSWIGLSLSQDRRKRRSGEYPNGLLIVDVQAGSPASKAGLQPPIEGKAREAAEMATLAAGMVFPPAMVGVAIIGSTQLDQSYDMIIGVDGDRITNILDFESHLSAVQPGEIIYLNIVRNGIRQQIPVYIPPNIGTRYMCGSLPCFPSP